MCELTLIYVMQVRVLAREVSGYSFVHSYPQIVFFFVPVAKKCLSLTCCFGDVMKFFRSLPVYGQVERAEDVGGGASGSGERAC